MKRYTNIETIAAYGRLLEFSSRKRYGVIENEFSNNVIDKIALQFNQEIKLKEKLDILLLEDDEQIIKYEEIVDKLLTKFSYEQIIQPDQSDEGRVLRESYPISIQYVKGLKLKSSGEFKDSSQAFPINIPTWISYCKTAHSAYALNFDGTPSVIFLTTKFTFKGRSLFALVLLYKDTNSTSEEWLLGIAGIFSKENYMAIIDHPIKVFLSFLKDYGLDLTINGNRKRIFYNIAIPRTYSMRDIVLTVHDELHENAPFTTQVIHRVTQLGIYLSIAYVIRDRDNKRDALSGAI